LLSLHKIFKKIFKFQKKNKILSLGIFLFILLILITFILPLFLFPSDKNIQSFKSFLKPSKKHLMGTDSLGHDIFEYIIKGTKLSFYISFCTILISSFIGFLLGILSGYFSGFWNTLANLICDLIMIFPDFILAFLIMLLYKKGVYQLIIILSICYLPTFIKQTKSATTQILQQDFIKSVICLGGSNFYIIFKHIIPHVFDSLIIRISLSLSSIILLSASFGFIGLGLDPSVPEWGSLLNTNKSFINIYPELILYPMIIILITNLSFNLISEGLVYYLNPKQKEIKD
jgi:peptide/nickel transport system permease protein